MRKDDAVLSSQQCTICGSCREYLCNFIATWLLCCVIGVELCAAATKMTSAPAASKYLSDPAQRVIDATNAPFKRSESEYVLQQEATICVTRPWPSNNRQGASHTSTYPLHLAASTSAAVNIRCAISSRIHVAMGSTHNLAERWVPLAVSVLLPSLHLPKPHLRL
jgi:hypothetical protein